VTQAAFESFTEEGINMLVSLPSLFRCCRLSRLTAKNLQSVESYDAIIPKVPLCDIQSMPEWLEKLTD